MMQSVMNAIELNDELWKSAECLRSKGLFRVEDFKAVAEAYEQNTSKMGANARELGFTDAKDLVRGVASLGGTLGTGVGVSAACVGSCSMAVTVAESTTLAGWLAGTGALSAGFTSAIAASGLILVIGASVGLLGLFVNRVVANGDRYSNEMKTKLLSAFHALRNANDAATNHKKALAAITSTLRSLEIPVSD